MSEIPLTLEAMNAASVASLVKTNAAAVRQASQLFMYGNVQPLQSIELELLSPYMRNPDGGLVDKPTSLGVAEETLTALHHAWHGSDKTEARISPNVTEVYWEFVDDEFLPWTVVEVRDERTMPSTLPVTAHVLTKRPENYQAILDAAEAERAAAEVSVADEPRWRDSEPVAPESVFKRWGRALSRFLEKQRDSHNPGGFGRRL